ncbi:hypothetical protein L1987_59256 [Smallanthus sonchifolius]|uniref:Uncharacterized protein n=1 Tax=Smallanthus sonchifolius TaxID=185202 RepID=A0ACB9D5L1_9ASTR|nr:hypothetical protein L1987_59256 [Smallanthus sonchifolius]
MESQLGLFRGRTYANIKLKQSNLILHSIIFISLCQTQTPSVSPSIFVSSTTHRYPRFPNFAMISPIVLFECLLLAD